MDSYLGSKYEIYQKTGKIRISTVGAELHNIGSVIEGFKKENPTTAELIKGTATTPGKAVNLVYENLVKRPLNSPIDYLYDKLPENVKEYDRKIATNLKDYIKDIADNMTPEQKTALGFIDTLADFTGSTIIINSAGKLLIKDSLKTSVLETSQDWVKKVFSKGDDLPSKKMKDFDPDTKKANTNGKLDNKNSDALNNNQGKINPVINEPINNVPENVVSKEAHLVDLRASMSKPHVENQELKKIVGELYKPNAKVGSGSTAAALREELATGKLVGGKSHDIKTKQYTTTLKKWIESNPTASPGDRAAAENILKDLHNALNGGKDAK
jgi:hypothetical protein